MKPFLIIYFSGVGNTKAVAEHIKICANKTSTEIYSMEKIPVDFSIDNHSAIIIGTCVYFYNMRSLFGKLSAYSCKGMSEA